MKSLYDQLILVLKVNTGIKRIRRICEDCSHAESGLILGAQIVGAEASTLISELSLSIEIGATVEDLAMTIHPHPALGEIIMEAAEIATRKVEKYLARSLV